ncbi:hypothetical protein KSP40_PGU014907 [Platanthera guangdongensis]|uniref:Ternary complex factor MIP1, leucine-zipper n=1 Tax=Platanthera guangdongensis TaxID=2320717 RepID=A0ABR2LIJ5_9ASPA
MSADSRGGRKIGEVGARCQASDSQFQETSRTQGQTGLHWKRNMSCYRFQLEEEVQMLEKQLQEEIDLHVVLAKAVGNHFSPLPISRSKLPVKAQELLASIVALEKIVAKLEEELFTLRFLLQHEEMEHHSTESHLKRLPVPSLKPPSSTSGYIWEKQVSSQGVSKFGSQVPSLHLEVLHSCEDSEPFTDTAENRPNEVLRRSSGVEEKNLDSFLHPPIAEFRSPKMKFLWQHPNVLSEEMVLCMRNIFLCLSGSTITCKASLSKCMFSPTSTGHVSLASFLSFSDSFMFPSSMQTSPEEIDHNCEVMDQENLCDPYGVNESLKWTGIGKYSSASEVSWMSVGKVQLDYAAEALKKFRFLVDQLDEVNPAKMNSDEKLAFWINLYNALIMHAYLAYGVPRTEIKLFSLMKKVSYTVGGQSFSAVDIEFIILKMKPPSHRPHIALVMTLHKFKLSEEHKRYSVECFNPLVLFALSCGMYSCPAVRIFTAKTVQEELQSSMTDYIQASVGVNEKGKLLLPKLLHSFTKGVVEDSFLVDWICRHLTPEQAAIVQRSSCLNKQRLLHARSFTVVPFNSRFRYLFLPCDRRGKSPA